MGIPRWLAIAALAAAFAFPAFAANPSVATIGPIVFTVEDTDLTDGIAAGVTLAPGAFGTYVIVVAQAHEPRPVTSVITGDFRPGSSGSAPFVSFGGSLTAAAEIPEGSGLLAVNATIADQWIVTLSPNTRASFSMLASADANASAVASVGDVTMAGTGAGQVLTFELASGGGGLSSLIGRRVNAFTQVTLATPIPEPGTALMLACGLLALFARFAPVRILPMFVAAVGRRLTNDGMRRCVGPSRDRNPR